MRIVRWKFEYKVKSEEKKNSLQSQNWELRKKIYLTLGVEIYVLKFVYEV